MQIGLCTDRDAWNRAVVHFNCALYHSWEWGEVRQTEGWIPWRVLVESEREPRAAVHILEKRLPMRAGSLLYAVRGIVGEDDDPLLVKELSPWLKAFARERSAILLRMDPEFPDREKSR